MVEEDISLKVGFKDMKICYLMNSRNWESLANQILYMSDAEGANSSRPNQAIFLDITYRSPAVFPRLCTSEGSMDQI